LTNILEFGNIIVKCTANTPPGFLFVQPKHKRKEYWQCIKLVAPTMEEKNGRYQELFLHGALFATAR